MLASVLTQSALKLEQLEHKLLIIEDVLVGSSNGDVSDYDKYQHLSRLIGLAGLERDPVVLDGKALVVPKMDDLQQAA
jgi:hypothetical protein